MPEITMRSEYMKKGLRDMIAYINTIRPTKRMDIAEIGVFEGDASVIFAEHFRMVYCVDPWDAENMNVQGADPEGTYQRFFDRVKDIKNIKAIRSTSEATSVYFAYCTSREFDIVYIDAKHDRESVEEDIDLWLPLIKPGGFISGHDYGSKRWPGVLEAVNKKLNLPDKVFCDSSWIVQVTDEMRG